MLALHNNLVGWHHNTYLTGGKIENSWLIICEAGSCTQVFRIQSYVSLAMETLLWCTVVSMVVGVMILGKKEKGYSLPYFNDGENSLHGVGWGK